MIGFPYDCWVLGKLEHIWGGGGVEESLIHTDSRYSHFSCHNVSYCVMMTMDCLNYLLIANKYIS